MEHWGWNPKLQGPGVYLSGVFSLIVRRHANIWGCSCVFVPTFLILQRLVHEKGRQAGFEKPGTHTQHPISLLVSRHNSFKPGNPYSKFKSIMWSPALCWLPWHLSRHQFLAWGASLSAAGALWLHHVHTDGQQTHPFSQSCAMGKAGGVQELQHPWTVARALWNLSFTEVGSTGMKLCKLWMKKSVTEMKTPQEGIKWERCISSSSLCTLQKRSDCLRAEAIKERAEINRSRT